MNTVIILDSETTDIKEPEPVEVAYVEYGDRLDLSTQGRSFRSLYKPSKPISMGAMAVHHIMDEDLVDAPPSTSFALPEGVEYLIGHNIDFDWKVIGEQANVKRICTLALSRSLFPDTDSHTLSAMFYLLERETARERLSAAHSALADVLLCADILKHFVCILGVTTWEELWLASEAARIPKVMPFGKHKGVPISEVPWDYLQWLSRQTDVDPYLLKAISN